MKRLYLLRHAKSSWDDGSLGDFQRPLNKRGERDAPMMARRWRKRGMVPDRIVSSSAVRAHATASIVARELGFPVANIVRDEDLYLADAARLLATARETDDGVGSVMLVAHNPGLTDLANALTEHRVDNLPTCALFCVDFDVERWRDLKRGGGVLAWFDYPKKVGGSGDVHS